MFADSGRTCDFDTSVVDSNLVLGGFCMSRQFPELSRNRRHHWSKGQHGQRGAVIGQLPHKFGVSHWSPKSLLKMELISD